LDSESDESLLEAGTESAMTRLVGRYERPLYAFLAKRCGDAQLAEDCFQETFLRAWRSRKRFERGRPLAPWLYRIAINVAKEALGRRRRDHALALEGDPKPDPNPGPADRAASDDAHGRVRDGIAALPDEERTVVELRLFGGLSFVEIAEAMRTPVTTARSRMVYAIRKLRPLLAAALGEEQA
jgi:RNA polymerase sigma-70 factor (ECF subfamily)